VSNAGEAAAGAPAVRERAMPALFAFRCQACGDIHEGAPSFAFDTPWYYAELPPAERWRAEST